jgi:hypothetical protein
MVPGELFPPQAFICPKDATPSFHHSIIPIFQLRSEADSSIDLFFQEV